ncbi:tyrosine recombinase xerc [Plakobranchus ocellatus]|uniref:Tyrosine recombinase xerc n=1 Tax=Plakobranchus ocellatus TaxID=259542 RepID=A0AAV4BWJ2_9GAST|nr:tyrosine recombinase xerc [Plakobranchus ocellatus]
MGTNAELSVRMLTLKLAMLIALTTGQRVQTIASISVNSVFFNDKGVTIKLDSLLKTTSPHNKNVKLDLPSYPEENVCVVHCMREYLRRTDKNRQSTNLFVSFISPYKAVTSMTISRWLKLVKLVLSKAGIDTIVFSAHSTRAAAASSAAVKLDIANVMASVGWKSSQTFHKFYYKPRVIMQDLQWCLPDSVFQDLDTIEDETRTGEIERCGELPFSIRQEASNSKSKTVTDNKHKKHKLVIGDSDEEGDCDSEDTIELY